MRRDGIEQFPYISDATKLESSYKIGTTNQYKLDSQGRGAGMQ